MGLYGNTARDARNDIITIVKAAIDDGTIAGAIGGSNGAGGIDGAPGQDGKDGADGADAVITAVALGNPNDLDALIAKLKTTVYFK